MKNWLSSVRLETVFSLLPNNLRQKSSLDCLKELRASSEKEFARKRFYQLNPTDSESIHLTYGSELDYQYENSKALHEAIPAFTCKPLFINNKDEYSLFGQEFFEGQAIDDLYNDCKIEKSEVTEILEKVHSIFQNLEKPSSIESANEEFKGFCKTILENKLFSEVDFQILEKEIFPLISSWIEKTNPTIRWSTGDLAARNILVNNNNDFRMVDCEFACMTHFHQEDWVRLSKFSVGKFSEHPFVTGISNKITFPVKLINLLKQTNLNRFVHNKIDYNFYLNQDAFDALQEILNIGEIKSIFLKAFSGRYEVMSDSFQQEQLLNSKLQEDQEKLTHEIDELSEFKTNSLQQIKQLQQTSVEYQEKLSQKENKILRMQHSFSWKVTMPIRFLRRVFLDNFYTKHKDCFDPNLYLELNPDLVEVFGQDINAAKAHFYKYGRKEGRLHKKTKKTHFKPRSYEKWIHENECRKFKTKLNNLETEPLFSIIMPVYNTNSKFLADAIQSILDQDYSTWELCIADDNSNDGGTLNILRKYEEKDSRIKILYRNENGGIAKATNSAISLASGTYLGFVDHDDLLSSTALSEVAKVLEKNKVKIIYTDEDKIQENGIRTSPYFKPDWNYNLFLSQNYLCHFLVIEKSTFDKHGCFRSKCDGAQDWDNLLHLIPEVKEDQIFHIPKILYHWRIHKQSTAHSVGTKEYVLKASKIALSDYCRRNSIIADVKIVQEHYFNIQYKIPTRPPLVSIIIPTKNNYHMLKKCVYSIISKTHYKNYKITIVDNESTEMHLIDFYTKLDNKTEVASFEGPFNHSALNNHFVKNNEADLCVLLNDDTEIINGNWLEELVSCSQQNSAGVIGCKLLYPNFRIQHAGVIIGIGNFAGHAFKHLEHDAKVMGCRLHLKQNYSAVTGACMLVKKNIFNEVGGFDEVNLPSSYNDVDFCLKVLSNGYKIVYTPTELIHHESYSRGIPNTEEKKHEEKKYVEFMKKKWPSWYTNDPNYNPNLTRIFEDFGL